METDRAIDPAPDDEAPLRDARFATWSMPRSEWDGFVARCLAQRRNLPLVLAGVFLALTLAVVITLASLVAPARPQTLVVMACCIVAMFVPGFILGFVLRRRGDRWRARAVHLWDEQGCVCPLCLAPLRERADDPAGCGHGFLVDDQPYVLRYLEALATAPEQLARQSMHGVDALRALRERAERRGTRPRGFLRRAARSVRVVWDHWLGFDQPMWRRVVAHLALAAAIVGCIAPFSWLGAATALWIVGFTFMGYRAIRSAHYLATRLHCAKCDHSLHSMNPATQCPECGASLAEPGSVRSTESRILVARWIVGCCFVFLGYYFPAYIAPSIGRALPNDLLFAAAASIPEASRDALEVLSARPLSPREQRQLADMMLPHIAAWAAGRGNNQSRNAQYIASSVANGTLPQEYAELLAHAACRLRIEVDGADVRADDTMIELDGARLAHGVPVRMYFMGHAAATSPALGTTVGVLSALEVDGTGVWDATAEDPPTLASDATATLALSIDGVTPPPGDHRIVIRAFVAIVPAGASIVAFDSSGAPVLVPTSLGPWRIERALTLRVR